MPLATQRRRTGFALGLMGALALSVAGCGVIPFAGAPAAGYVYGSGAPLRVTLIDETGGDDWAPAIAEAARTYDAASARLEFVENPAAAHIVMRVRRYVDSTPPELRGYSFQPGVGGFAAVYDAAGVACNFPPSRLPLRCSGEIASVEIYVNDVIPPGDDIETRRLRLLLHEMGHGLGLTRHSPDLAVDELSQRYGWPAE